MKNKLKAFFRVLWQSISHNFWLKLLSLVMALMLWNSVISSNSTLTRNKTISGLTGYLAGQATLEANKLALAEDPAAALSNIGVIIEVARSEYAYVSADNIQVALDLSSVRGAGSQQVRLRASTAYGRVAEIIPSSVTLNFEALDSRSIPVNVKLEGDMREDLYYSYTRVNPSTITVSGAASVVQSVASAYVYDDVSGHDSPYTSAEQFVLQDSGGNEISQTLLSLSSSSITVSVGIYPTRELPVSTNFEDVLAGQVADGYVIQSVTIQPDTVTVAGDSELLEGLTSLLIEPVSVEGASQSFSARARIASLTDFRYISTEQVYVNVNIAEESVSAWIDKVNISYVGQDENLTLSSQRDSVTVFVTGPKSKIHALEENGLDVVCDLTGLKAGTYQLTLDYGMQYDDSITFEPSGGTITVTLSEASTDE